MIKRREKIKVYFSFICITPIEVKSDKAITGAQTDKIKGILFVCPNANDRSLK